MTNSRLALLAFILASFGCAGKSSPSTPLPSGPTAAVEQFLAAVKANDLRTMGELWGSDKGPANNWMDQDYREKALTVMRMTLVHDSYAIDPAGTLPGGSERERVVRVQLRRNNCRPTVPFTTLHYQDGWLVTNIDLEAAGNPRRPCP
ncbi:MAG: hypothetical protein Q8W45_00895 [Candidatus Palauibacterales bacterium]|nr:hypothetical protein [Candidatus Palauibacterales bacterium]